MQRLPIVDLSARTPTDEVCRRMPLDACIDMRAVVYGQSDGQLLVASAKRPCARLATLLSQYFPDTAIQHSLDSQGRIDHFLRQAYRNEVQQRAVLTLYRNWPVYSAHSVFTRSQFLGLALLVLGLLAGAYFAPVATGTAAVVIISMFFMLSILFKFVVSLAGARAEREIAVSDEEVAALDEATLPSFTVLVPVHREEAIVHQVMHHVASVDYPKDRLEILILIEENDDETWNAALAAKPPEFVQLVRIPAGLPQTKPRACNAGLVFARGEYTVIFDAEDKPDADQLKKVVLAFRKGPTEMICVQAALNYYNARENWLTRMFTLEYSYWYDYMLPGLARLGLPIPLGGTSNHFRTDRLRELGGWDAFNVTEDADLGIRASAMGYTIGLVNSTTMEEAVTKIPNWSRQRTRWIKGYMQTALVHSRHPMRLVRAVGLKKALAFALLIGGTPITFLAYIPSLSIYLYWILTRSQALDPYFPVWVVQIGLFNLLLGNGISIYLGMLAIFKRKQYGLILYSLTHPVYWLLHARASYKALWQLFTKPFLWGKTDHGQSKQHAER
jgi:cellulose synthase/poly-beta-1,6-N-acetylglucosamine synthase-like glycosyltransferase